MKFLFCFLYLCLYYSATYSQQDYLPGYIVQNNLDTLRGYIERTMDADLSKEVHFKNSLNGTIQNFTPDNANAFGVEHDQYKSLHFINTSLDTIPETAFLKQVVTGEYNLYAYSKDDRKFYILQKDTNVYFLYDRVSSGRGEIIKEGNYLNYLHFISVPCDNLASIYDRVTYNEKDISAFLVQVDNCLAPGKTTNLYQKPKTEIKLDAFAGALPLANNSQFSASFLLRIILPKIDKKTSFNIGLNYSYTITETTARTSGNVLYTSKLNNRIFSVPVTVQYNFTTTRVQPYFYGGFSAAYITVSNEDQGNYANSSSSNFSFEMVAGMGIQVKIVSGLYVKVDWRYEYIIQYPAIGIGYQF